MTKIENKKVSVANGFVIDAIGKGNCKLNLSNENGQVIKANLSDVLYVPKLLGNFISIKNLIAKGYIVKFSDEKAEIIHKGKSVGTAHLKNELFKLCSLNEVLSGRKVCIHYLHRLFGHRNIDSIKQMIKNQTIIGIDLKNCTCNSTCGICVQSKMTRKSFVKEKPKVSKDILDLVHTDICGPIQTISHAKKRYVLTFIDDYSRYTKIYFLKEKSEVKDKVVEFVELMQTQMKKKPKRFNSDRGGEYMSENLKTYLQKQGIEFQYTSSYTPQLNGVAERKNRTLIEMTRCLLNDSNLPKQFWAEGVNTANYLQNRLLTTSTGKTPYELWHGKRPQI